MSIYGPNFSIESTNIYPFEKKTNRASVQNMLIEDSLEVYWNWEIKQPLVSFDQHIFNSPLTYARGIRGKETFGSTTRN